MHHYFYNYPWLTGCPFNQVLWIVLQQFSDNLLNDYNLFNEHLFCLNFKRCWWPGTCGPEEDDAHGKESLNVAINNRTSCYYTNQRQSDKQHASLELLREKTSLKFLKARTRCQISSKIELQRVNKILTPHRLLWNWFAMAYRSQNICDKGAFDDWRGFVDGMDGYHRTWIV